MRTEHIERRRALDPASFSRELLQGGGKPVIVTDALDQWAARSKWTFEFFKTAYGSDLVCPAVGLYSDAIAVTTLSAYIDWIGAPAAELQGVWMDRTSRLPLSASPSAPESPPYLIDQNAFYKHPELFDDIGRMYFVEDWLSALNASVRETFESAAGRTFWGVLIGPAGSVSRLHRDFHHTHSWLAQIRGRKRVILFSPEDSDLLYGGAIEPDQPDLDRFDLLRGATAYDGILEPGDVLFTPADWWHWVRGLEPSITVAHNFFNQSNFSAYMDDFLGVLTRSRRAQQ